MFSLCFYRVLVTGYGLRYSLRGVLGGLVYSGGWMVKLDMDFEIEKKYYVDYLLNKIQSINQWTLPKSTITC